jgi:hypothetical protein
MGGGAMGAPGMAGPGMDASGGGEGTGRPGGEGRGSGRRTFAFGGPGGPAGTGGSGANLSDEDRKKMREAMQKALNGKSMQDLTPEERAKVFEEVRKSVPALAKMQRPGGGQQGSRGEGRGEGRGERGSGGIVLPGGFTEKDLQNAKLPPAIEEGNQLDVLLRPGLLADVEIIVEKIPNAVNIPNQAVFEKDGKLVVFVRKEKGWEERAIKPFKRSESVLVIAEGLKPGEEIAMSDPTAKPGDKKKDKPAGASPMGGMPAGGGRS